MKIHIQDFGTACDLEITDGKLSVIDSGGNDLSDFKDFDWSGMNEKEVAEYFWQCWSAFPELEGLRVFIDDERLQPPLGGSSANTKRAEEAERPSPEGPSFECL